jgi:GxxExxY protein
VKAFWCLIAALWSSSPKTKPVQPCSVQSAAIKPPRNGIADRIVQCASIVANTLGSGLPEIIYENALAHELRKAGLAVSQQKAVAVYYDGMIVGDYTADLLVENTILIDLKATKTLDAIQQAECLNYLKATRHTLCLLFNFGAARLQITQVANGT